MSLFSLPHEIQEIVLGYVRDLETNDERIEANTRWYKNQVSQLFLNHLQGSSFNAWWFTCGVTARVYLLERHGRLPDTEIRCPMFFFFN